MNWVRKNWLSILLVMVGAALFVILLLVMFNESVEYWVKMALGVERKRDAVQFIGLGIAGVVAIAGAVAVSRRAEAQVRNNELIERGHVQERFKAAVEHLESKDESVRIASFYEFNHLARDNEGLRRNIFDILCAHLRWTTTDKEYKEKIGFVEEGENPEVRHTEEVRSLLDVLFQSKDSQTELIFRGLQSNLRGIFLVRAKLYGANLQSARLRETNLQGADLETANLRGAGLQGVDLRGAHLQSAELQKADLQSAYLRGAHLQGADLREADLRDVKLRGAYLQRADLRETKLHGAELRSANLSGANLEGTNLQGVYLQEANLSGAKLQGADLQGAKLWGVNLSDAVLQDADLQYAYLQGVYLLGADLQGADLRKADLQGVDLRRVKNLETADLGGAKIKRAMFPEGYEPPADADTTSDD